MFSRKKLGIAHPWITPTHGQHRLHQRAVRGHGVDRFVGGALLLYDPLRVHCVAKTD
jgi:hypothetical protein